MISASLTESRLELGRIYSQVLSLVDTSYIRWAGESNRIILIQIGDSIERHNTQHNRPTLGLKLKLRFASNYGITLLYSAHLKFNYTPAIIYKACTITKKCASVRARPVRPGFKARRLSYVTLRYVMTPTSTRILSMMFVPIQYYRPSPSSFVGDHDQSFCYGPDYTCDTCERFTLVLAQSHSH